MNNSMMKSQIQSSICIQHFPEPIIYISEEPMCKKCISEYLEKMRKKNAENRKESNEEAIQQTDKLRELFGVPKENHFLMEKHLVTSSIIKLDDFKGDFRYLNEDIEDRVNESNQNLTHLPELMCKIFSTAEKAIAEHKVTFLNELDEVINKQQASFKRDNETKVPNFYERLSQKYTQLQQATQNAYMMNATQICETLNQYYQVFMQLDAEFEKYFNEFENISKLQRLLDKDSLEIVTDFQNLLESNLRVDYNIKNSFRPGVPARVHSFQWNQKFAYLFKVNKCEFEKKLVQMEFEVPLYSRSIATEDGTIFLIGGCNKRKN